MPQTGRDLPEELVTQTGPSHRIVDLISDRTALIGRPAQRVSRIVGSVAGIALCLAAGIQSPAMAGDYQLGPQDKVRLKIYEWRPSRDEIFEWTALNDQFTIGAGGELSLPLVGGVDAAGTTPSELGHVISQRLMQHMGLARQPDVAVEVVQFRPFYMVGQVMQPGEFPYRPGLTVLQALSIAGGLRTREENLARLEREVIAGKGDVDLLKLNYVSLLARKARLEAEQRGMNEVVFPKQLTDRQEDSTVRLMMDQERSVFSARRDGMATQARALKELKEFLVKETDSLEQQLTFFDTQIELVQKELSGVSSLVSKGFTAAQREMSVQRDMAQIQSSRLAAETALLRARQETSRTDISILELQNQRMNEVATALRETQMQLDEITRKADTAVQLLHDSEMTAPRLLALRSQAANAQPKYTIVRLTAQGGTELTATESTEVQPGDTVKVEIPLPPGLEDLEASFAGPNSFGPALATDGAGTN
jgi:polysaccharide export outer membrane protein/exopolysaccharide production protein ExoF